ncbi:uncharacterized protein K452DRAFT_288867 [Aplosporella prunicola CBS 121167]|uniref:Rhomboid family membrane protein n=1 Tax=Aplosporella prunicola CBS 121167 TaxID=1176127 RepID=A0A6A6BC20_9PEZI|nr:uncharacterized protein K452DRAFT_288867 [Aplosporella prunicola CBS 121167]KAF2140785.1 hypothetical protein K452DRAFT_288867 [Aplosporella prunicola CBS 121167]
MAHHLSMWLLVACPVIALLPPRKLDVYTTGLGVMTLVSAEHLMRERTGGTLLQRVGRNFDTALTSSSDLLPTERARQVHEVQRRAKEEREALLRADGSNSERNALQRAWMGGETEGWKERRLKEEREAIEEGRGYGSLIMEQIWEVWNGGKANAEKVEDRDLQREVQRRVDEAERKS